MSSLSLNQNSQVSPSPQPVKRPKRPTQARLSFLGQLNGNGSNGAALSIANPQFGSRSSSAGKLHLKGFLG